MLWVSASNNYLCVSRRLLLRKSCGTGLAHLCRSDPEDLVMLWVCVLRAPNSGTTRWDRIIFESIDLELQQNPKRSCLLIENKVMLRILSTRGKRGRTWTPQTCIFLWSVYILCDMINRHNKMSWHYILCLLESVFSYNKASEKAYEIWLPSSCMFLPFCIIQRTPSQFPVGSEL